MAFLFWHIDCERENVKNCKLRVIQAYPSTLPMLTTIALGGNRLSQEPERKWQARRRAYQGDGDGKHTK